VPVKAQQLPQAREHACPLDGEPIRQRSAIVDFLVIADVRGTHIASQVVDGLYDLDPRESFKIDRTGTYRIVVGTWDGVVGGYELAVHRVD
jgi:hypothetical protein